ncbi:MAG: c-type cytochrome [Candidatus Eremiobacteraeota bacterium]|nr:c-type cytochrome [Candidatus Eremiobacteraeota bacterium]
MKNFILGIVAALVVLAVIGFIGVTQGILIPANADAVPSKLERWAAGKSLHATIAREATLAPNPLAANDVNLEAGVKLYAANCAACHGTADGKPSTIAFGLYQKAPQFANDGVEDDPEGVTYWKVSHGIRLTGMPAFVRSLDRNDIWKIALFLKHMDALPPAAKKLWEQQRNPVAMVPQDRLPRKEARP